MKKNLCLTLCLFVLLSGTLTGVSYAADQPAQQVVESFLSTICSMEFPVKDQARHDELASKANQALDLEALGRKALTDHWGEATPAQQKEFLQQLWKLIEYVAYPKSRRFMGKYEITYPEVKEVSRGVEVHSVIKQEAQALDAKVIYHLYTKEGVWKIDDIILDDVSIIEDLQYQFDSIIKESQFPGLLQKMKERLDQAVKENGSAIR
ncbi:MAG: ABC transporter substrate-binding protein [Candidatus Omnitrophica bacterium]|nr:ABC transporter substrate-binding protein [Candidatus Omnitrophota bacterium]